MLLLFFQIYNGIGIYQKYFFNFFRVRFGHLKRKIGQEKSNAKEIIMGRPNWKNVDGSFRPSAYLDDGSPVDMDVGEGKEGSHVGEGKEGHLSANCEQMALDGVSKKGGEEIQNEEIPPTVEHGDLAKEADVDVESPVVLDTLTKLRVDEAIRRRDLDLDERAAVESASQRGWWSKVANTAENLIVVELLRRRRNWENFDFHRRLKLELPEDRARMNNLQMKNLLTRGKGKNIDFQTSSDVPLILLRAEFRARSNDLTCPRCTCFTKNN